MTVEDPINHIERIVHRMWKTNDREKAREAFQEWSEYYGHREGLVFRERTNDVATFWITANDDSYNGRDMVYHVIHEWRPPLRVITLEPARNPGGHPVIEVEILLAEIGHYEPDYRR